MPPLFHPNRQCCASLPPIPPIFPPGEWSWLSYVDYSSTHHTGGNIASVDCHFLKFHSCNSQDSFEIRPLASHRWIRLPGCRIMFNVLEGALSVLMRLLKTWLEWEGLLCWLGKLGNFFEILMDVWFWFWPKVKTLCHTSFLIYLLVFFSRHSN